MIVVKIKAEEKKGYVSIDDGEIIICPIVKDGDGKYSLNIKKLDLARSFVSIGDLEDKDICFEISELNTLKKQAAREPRRPQLPAEAEEFLNKDEYAQLNALYDVIYERRLAKFKADKEAKKPPMSDLRKLEIRLAKVMSGTPK